MIEQLILDMKGVLYDEVKIASSEIKVAREGALGFIKYLKEKQLPFIFGTNVTSEMKEDIVADLNKAGFNISPDNVASCIDLSSAYLKSQGIERIFLISDNEELREFYKKHGFDLVGYNSQAVVAGLDKGLEKRTMKKAAYEIRNGAKLIALHRNMTMVDGDGRIVPNVGQLVKDLEEITGYTATVTIGKPSEIFYLWAMKKLPFQNPAVTLMVGDDPEGDLSGANKLGMQTAFVKSKKYGIWPVEIGFKPDYKVSHLGELVGKF